MQPTPIDAALARSNMPHAVQRPPVPTHMHRGLRSRLRSLRAREATRTPPLRGEIVIRRALKCDADAIVRLAELDERPLPAGDLLVAEHDGEVSAALPLYGGLPVADPFRPTAELVSLLSLRADQVRSDGRRVARGSRLRPAIAAD